MARGFDSKSVEEQQAEYLAKRAGSAKSPVTPEEAARHRERETLELNRKQVEAQIKAARSEQHRKMLEAALAEIERRLGRVGQ